MKDLAYYNGEITPMDAMMIPMNDRAVYFGDGVYDMAYVRNKVCFALQDHVDRFFNSCRLMEIPIRMSKGELTALLNKLADMLDDDLEDVMLYFQMSRGTAAARPCVSGSGGPRQPAGFPQRLCAASRDGNSA